MNANIGLTKTNSLKDFSRTDWYGFAGAEALANLAAVRGGKESAS